MALNIMQKLKLKFTSGNSVPVDRAFLSAEEYKELLTHIESLKGYSTEGSDGNTV